MSLASNGESGTEISSSSMVMERCAEGSSSAWEEVKMFNITAAAAEEAIVVERVSSPYKTDLVRVFKQKLSES